ncbi:hypothetical protein D3C81_1548510 [compost metagenome]
MKEINKPSVASAGVDSGRIMRKKIRYSRAPSILADSMISIGIFDMNPFITIMLNGDSSTGRINASKLSFRCKYCVIRMYEGTNPPLNSIVKNT